MWVLLVGLISYKSGLRTQIVSISWIHHLPMWFPSFQRKEKLTMEKMSWPMTTSACEWHILHIHIYVKCVSPFFEFCIFVNWIILLLISHLCELKHQFSSVQSLSRVRLFATPWIAACQASLSITNARSSVRLASIESVMPASHLILCHPLLLLPVHQGCILSPCLFNLYAEHIMRNAGLEEAQAGIKSARRNINNLRYADDTTLMAESEEELKSLLMKVKVESELKHTSVKLIICNFSSQSALYFWSTDWASLVTGDSDSKESACTAEDPGSIPGLGRSPGGGHGNPPQYSFLENPMDRGAW